MKSSRYREFPTHAIFSERRGLNDIKYDVPVRHSCRKMIIQQANLLGPVHILKPYTFQSEFGTVVRCLVFIITHPFSGGKAF